MTHYTWDEWALLVATLTAIVVHVGFAADYGRVDWRRSGIGRALMAAVLATLLLGAGAMMRRVGTWTGDRAWSDVADWTVAAGWLAIAATRAWQWRQMRLAQRNRPHKSMPGVTDAHR